MATTAANNASVVLPVDAVGVLAAARERRKAADAAEADLLRLAVQWAIIHPAETLDDSESYASRVRLWSGTEQPTALAGPGAPLVREFAVAEFAAAVGLGTETGKHYLGHAVELRYRLPKLWARVVAGGLAAWKARRVAAETIGHRLSPEAAAYVDVQVAPVAHKIRPAQLDRHRSCVPTGTAATATTSPPYATGGATCSCQIAPLCRHHHRIKTHTGWTYTLLEPGTYHWTSPHGYHYLRDHTGTLDTSRD